MIRSLLPAIALAACASPTLEAPRPPIERAFVIPEPDMVPEGIAYDPQTGATYVSSTWQRRIVRIARDGAQSDFTPRDSNALYGIIGMHVDAERRRLWAAHSSAGAAMPIRDDSSNGSSGLALFDLQSGRMLRNLLLTDGAPHFLNDLDIARDGSLYISDTMSGIVYRVGPNGAALEPFLTLPDEGRGNGVALSEDERTLYVANARGGAFHIDIATRRATAIGLPEGVRIGADGLYLYDGDIITVQPWTGDCRVCRYTLDETGTRVTGVRTLLGAHPDILQPTTGVISGRDIYVIANSQLQHYRQLWVAGSGVVPREQLHDIVVLRVALDQE
jgi:sugar lactone lactonase YvrE